MDDARFDRFTRILGTRRTTVGALLGLAAALVVLDSDANRKKKKKKHAQSNRGEGSRQPAAVHADGKKRKRKKKKKPKGCGLGTITCGSTCVNPNTDAENCGGCGTRCGSGVACVDGRCVSTCPASQIRCVDLCVDPSSNERHCGGCGQQCTGDLTCLNGVCGCATASDTTCGNQCLDLQTDDENCGGCGVACNDNQRCRGGQCVITPCEVDELDCGNGVCAGGANPCCSNLHCGAGNGELVCDTDSHQCVCDRPDEGICHRFSNGAGLCDVCCGSGSRICIDDTVCVDGSTPGSRFCDCSAGKRRCAGSQNAHKCQTGNGAQDDRRCGIDCTDCTALGPTSFCCNGTCMTACAPNTVCSLSVCDDCEACGANQACCRSGTSNLFGCTLLDEFGRCPGPPP